MSANQVIRSVERLFERSHIIEVSEAAGQMARAIIDQRTRRGEFLGGRFANKGYSEAPMPFSELTRQISVDESETFWISRDGKAQKFLIGGYKKFREKTGRATNKVNLDFSGEMMNSLFVSTDFTGFTIKITVTVPSGQMLKAYYTDRDREWLGLSDEEADRVLSVLQNNLLQD